MKFRFATVAALLLAATSAFAAAPTNTPQSGVNSDLFLAVVNQTTGKSEIIDLGVTANSLTNGQTFNLDPNLATTLGAGTLTYQLVAGDISNSQANGFAGQTLYVSGNTQYAGTNMNAQTISNALGAADGYLVAINMSAVNGYQTFVSTGSSNNWGPTAAGATAPGKNLGQTGFDFTAAVGSALNFYSYVVSGSASDQPTTASTATKLGSFTLTGSTLTFAVAAAATPIPAALWLLSSGLLGLGAARRRRSAAVAA
jgi:hypothetical protein